MGERGRGGEAALPVRRADERGLTRTDWLESRHSFSFGNYYDPAHMGIGPLRVLNDDVVAPGAGFGPHPHRDMEIVSYVLAGALAHRDSSGHEGVVRAGEAQFMRAGAGVVHSETNASLDAPVRFLQIWLLPRRRGLAPRYEDARPDVREGGGWVPLVGPRDGDGIRVDADARILTARVRPREALAWDAPTGRQSYAFLAGGEALVAGARLREGDAVRVPGGSLHVEGVAPAHVLLFDLPAP